MSGPATPLVTVPLPTIDGRERFFGDAVRSYEETANVEILVYENLPSCGAAWLKGIQEGTGDYFHMGADDVEMHPGWAEAAIRVCDMGFLPTARILNTNGTLQSCGLWEEEMPNGMILRGDLFTRSPMFSQKQWEALEPLVAPILGDLHYFSDNVFTWAGRMVGIQTVVCRGYEYTHHLAQVGRGGGMGWNERMQHDHALYMDYIRSVG